jgi:ribose transport system permease protein
MRSVSASALYWRARTTIAWVLCAAVFAWFAVGDADFLNTGNVYALLQILAPLVLVACGLAVVMLTAEFDLSIAGTFPLAGLVAVRLSDSAGPVTAAIAAVLLGMVIGLINGVLVGLLRIPSLAVTVATMVFSIGLGYLVTDDELVRMEDYGPSLRLTERIAEVFSLASLVQLALAAVLIGYVAVSWRGRYLYAVGSDKRRARASGLPVARTVVVAFVVSAGCSAVAGSLQGLSLATGQAGSDDAFLLNCATAALVGGIALTGARGSLLGVVGGALLLSLLTNGLGLAGVATPLIQLVNGVVLIAVVLTDKPVNAVIRRRLQAELALSQQHDPISSAADDEVDTAGSTPPRKEVR